MVSRVSLQAEEDEIGTEHGLHDNLINTVSDLLEELVKS